MHQDDRRGWTVLEVATPDRPGLLANIGAVFIDQNLSLQAAKIQTLFERVEDFFFVTSTDGNSIGDENALNRLEDAIKRALDAELPSQL